MTSEPRKLISERELRLIVMYAFFAGMGRHASGKGVHGLTVEETVRLTAVDMAGIEVAQELDITDEIQRQFRAKHRAAA